MIHFKSAQHLFIVFLVSCPLLTKASEANTGQAKGITVDLLDDEPAYNSTRPGLEGLLEGLGITKSNDEAGNSLFEAKNASLRQDFKFQADVFTSYVGSIPIPSRGIQLGYFLSAHTLVFFEASYAQTHRGPEPLAHYDVGGNAYGLHVRNFEGGYFNYRFGIDYRSVQSNVSQNDEVRFVERSFFGNTLALNLQIGHRWQIGNFTVGVDWIGVELPIYSKLRSESISSSDPDKAAKEQLRDQESLVTKITMNALQFSLGCSF